MSGGGEEKLWTPTLQKWGVSEPKLSNHVRELSLKCNQGSNNVHFSASILVHTVTSDKLNGTRIKMIKMYAFIVFYVEI